MENDIQGDHADLGLSDPDAMFSGSAAGSENVTGLSNPDNFMSDLGGKGGGHPAAPPPPGGARHPHAPRTQFQKGTAPPPPAAPRAAPEKELSWGESLSQGAHNFLPSLGSMAGSVVNAAVHPLETIGTLGHLAQGAGSQVAGALGAQQDQQKKAKEEALITALEGHYKQAYGSLKGFKKYLANDPAGLLSDLSTVATAGAGGVGLGLGSLAKGAEAAGMANTASNLGKAASVASKASHIASMADPVALGLQAAKGIGKIGSTVAGAGATGLSAMATGKRYGAIADAAKAGATADPTLRAAFKSHLTGSANPMELADTVNEALQTLKKSRGDAFVNDMRDMSAKGHSVDWSSVDDAINEARQSVNYMNKSTGQHVPVNTGANDALDQIEKAAQDFRSDPSLESMHAFKQRVDDIRQAAGANAQANRVATHVHRGTLDALGQAYPEYSKTMQAYGDASDVINEIGRTFKMGGRNATAEKQLKAMLATKTGSQKETLIAQLAQVDPRIPYMLAGQELHGWTPHGIRSALITSPASYAAPHAAFAAGVAASPRLAGSVALNAGRAERAIRPLFSPSAGKALRAAGQSMDDQDPSVAAPAAPAAPGPSAPPKAPGDFDRILQQESGNRQLDKNGNPITSSKGATGIAQVMPKTGPEAAQLAGLPWDPERFRMDADYNKALGEAYFDKQMNDFGDPALAAAAYNAGPGRVRDALATAEQLGDHWLSHVPEETRDYVSKFLKGRLGRASGGKVGSGGHEYLVARLLKAAKDAKKATDKTTEPLLKVPDAHIVKALDVAQRAI